jgi:hypothetical protein
MANPKWKFWKYASAPLNDVSLGVKGYNFSRSARDLMSGPLKGQVNYEPLAPPKGIGDPPKVHWDLHCGVYS